MRTLASLDSPINSLVVSPDGSTVITASTEGIGFLDLTSGRRSVTTLEDEASRLAWGPHGLLAGTLSGEVWSVGNAPARLFEAIDEEISGIAATSDGTIAVCGGEPFAVATFGPHGNEEWRGEPYKWPYCVRFSSDGKLLAVATWDGYLFVFDAHDLPDELNNLDGEHAGGPIFDARFLPGDRVLVVGASFVRIWDRGVARYTCNCELDAEAFAVDVSPDGSCAVVSTNDQRLRLFALPDLTELGQLASGNKGTAALSYFPDYAEFCHVKGPATIRTLAFHPDGTRLFGSTEDHRIVEVSRAELQRISRPATTSAQASPAAPAMVAPASIAAPGRATSMQPASKPSASKPSASRKVAQKAGARAAAAKAGPKAAAAKAVAKAAAAKAVAKAAAAKAVVKAAGGDRGTNAAGAKTGARAAGAKTAASAVGVKTVARAAGGKPGTNAAAANAGTRAAAAKTAARAIGAKPAARGAGAKPGASSAGARTAARTTGVKPVARPVGAKAASTRLSAGKRAATKMAAARPRRR